MTLHIHWQLVILYFSLCGIRIGYLLNCGLWFLNCFNTGHFRILYIDDDYSHSLFHTCVQPNEADGSCQMVVVEVASRSNQLSTDKMDDLMSRAHDVCVEPSNFALLKHEGRK